MQLGSNGLRLGTVVVVVAGLPIFLAVLLSHIGGDAQTSGIPIPGITDFAVPVLGGVGRITESIDQEPVSLEKAHDLIESGRVSLIVVQSSKSTGAERWYSLGDDLADSAPRWKLVGVNVLLFTGATSTGVPILFSDQGEVGVTDAQLEDLLERVDQYNATASTPIDVLDERGQ
ncbi:MAG TPA: hypothetical protein VGR43_04800 [Dehalococcoidia bacterium]|nr:hypothetical protein [Dehalococcoidia bacterium]